MKKETTRSLCGRLTSGLARQSRRSQILCYFAVLVTVCVLSSTLGGCGSRQQSELRNTENTLETIALYVQNHCSADDLLAWGTRITREHADGVPVAQLAEQIPQALRRTPFGVARRVMVRQWNMSDSRFVFVEYGGTSAGFFGIVIDPSSGMFVPGSQLCARQVLPGVWAYARLR